MDRLDEIVKLVGSNAVGKKEGHLVVQKYIGNVWLKHWVYVKKKKKKKGKHKTSWEDPKKLMVNLHVPANTLDFSLGYFN